ncbi:MAG: hypothetical protein XD95_0226 [Microgenomates bacterium 39_7]|nr:MAG: hypothetical protein XD95_0226 [Microgenomates bacterium 39_7]
MESKTKLPHNSQNNFVDVVVNVITLAFTFLFLADSFANNKTSTILLPQPAIAYLWIVIALLVIFRLTTEFKLVSWFQNILSKFLLPITIVLAVLTSIVDFFTPVNQVFIWTRLHQEVWVSQLFL